MVLIDVTTFDKLANNSNKFEKCIGKYLKAMFARLLEQPSLLISVLALFVAIFSFFAASQSAIEAKKQTELNTKLAEQTRPRVKLQVEELGHLQINEDRFNLQITFSTSNKGGRFAKNVQTTILPIPNSAESRDFDIEYLISIFDPLKPMFSGESLHPNENQTNIFPLSGNTEEFILTENDQKIFVCRVLIAVSYEDEFTEKRHWTFHYLPIARINNGIMDLVSVDNLPVDITDLSVNFHSKSNLEN